MENQVNRNLMRMISIQLSTEERYSDKIQMASTETSGKQLMMAQLYLSGRYPGRAASQLVKVSLVKNSVWRISCKPIYVNLLVCDEESSEGSSLPQLHRLILQLRYAKLLVRPKFFQILYRFLSFPYIYRYIQIDGFTLIKN